jgi:chromosome segregation ATPase
MNRSIKDPITWLLVAFGAIAWIVASTQMSAKGDAEDSLRKTQTELAGARAELTNAKQQAAIIETQLADTRRQLTAHQQASGDLTKLDQDLMGAKTRLDSVMAQQKQAGEALDVTNKGLETVRASLSQAERELTERNGASKAAEEKLRQIESLTNETQQRYDKLSLDSAARNEELRAINARIELARRHEAEMRESTAKVAQEISARTGEAADVQTRLQAARLEAEELQHRHSTLQSEITQRANEMERLNKEIATLTRDRDNLAADVRAAQAEYADVQGRLAKLSQEVADRSKELTLITERMQRGNEELAALREQLASEAARAAHPQAGSSGTSATPNKQQPAEAAPAGEKP